jgi:hypothetical protein
VDLRRRRQPALQARSALGTLLLGPAAAVGAGVIDEPLRTGGTGGTLRYPFLPTFAVGGAIGAGCRLRPQDVRRQRTIVATGLAEPLQLARELHGLVAHHVTGSITQAQAAGVIHESAPQQIGPLAASTLRRLGR